MQDDAQTGMSILPGFHAPGSSNHRGPGGLLPLLITIRLVLNTSYRMVYPFLQSFAGGIGVTLQSAALPLTGRSLVGVLGPVFAPIVDRYGRKRGMLLGLGMFTAGVGLVVLWPGYFSFFMALILANLGNQVFLPAMQAYLGDRIPFQKRGRVLALTELAWSLSFLSLLPLSFLIGRFGWVAPFWMLAGLGGLAILLLAWKVPPDHPHPSQQPGFIWGRLREVITSPAARTALLFGFSITLGNEVINVAFGVWLGDAFELKITALGLSALVIGAAELCGEAATAWLVDRVGKKRAVRTGAIFTALAAVLLPWLGQTLWGAMLGLFLFYLGFEFTLVSYIPVMTEVIPEARATMMAANLASNSLGRALGAQLGLLLYSTGFGLNGIAAMLLYGLALLVLPRIRVKE